MSEGMPGVVSTHWEIFRLTAQEEAEMKREQMDKVVGITVHEFLVSVDHRAVSFHVDLRYSETDRHAEITAFSTETRKARFEKA